MSRRICDDELPFWCGEIPVSHINSNSLLTFCAKTISKQSEVDVFISPLSAGFLDRIVLILENGFGIVQQPANQRALAIIYTTCSGKPQ